MKQQRPLRAANGYDIKAASNEVVIDESEWGPSLTVQSQALDTDINEIVRRAGITGQLPENPRLPTYGDFTGIGDYRSALEAVRKAEEGFMEIPAEIRARFANDPQQFMDFCEQEKNLPELRAMGLAKPPKQTTVPLPQEIPNATDATTHPTTGNPTQATTGKS